MIYLSFLSLHVINLFSSSILFLFIIQQFLMLLICENEKCYTSEAVDDWYHNRISLFDLLSNLGQKIKMCQDFCQKNPKCVKNKMFLSLLAFSTLKGYDLSLGFFSTNENVMWAQKLDGLHTCFDDDEDSKTTYSVKNQFLEGKIPLNVSNAYLNNETYILNHCNFTLNKKLIKKWKAIANPSVYLSFHSGKTQFRVKSFTISPNGTSFFTNYLIYIAENSDLTNPVISVMPSNPVLLQNDAKMNITFNIEFTTVELPQPYHFKFPYLYLLIALSSIFLAFLIRCQISRKYETVTLIDIVNIWSPPRHLANYLMFSFGSLTYFFILIFATLLWMSGRDIIYAFLNAYIFSVIIPTYLRVLYDFVFNIQLFEPYFESPILLPMIFFGPPFIVYLQFTRIIFKSYVNYNIFEVGIFIAAFLCPFLVTRAVAHISYFSFPKSLKIEKQLENRKDIYRFAITDYLLIIFYNIAVLIGSFEFYQHLIDVCLDAIPFNFELAWQTVLLTTAFGISYGCFQTMNDIKRERSFLVPYLTTTIVSGFVTSLYCLVEVFANRKISNWMSIIRALIGSYGAIGATTAITSFAPFITSFLIVFSIFRL